MPRLLQSLRALGLILVAMSIACGSPQEAAEPQPEASLKETVIEYNRMLKWGRYEQAADYVAAAHREAFMGRYEERGEDFKIVGLELMSVAYEGKVAVIETEQEWYDESMVVKKDRFIELWSSYGGEWYRGERMTKKEYRKRKKELFPSNKVDPSAVEPKPEDSAESATEPKAEPKDQPVQAEP